MAIGNVVQMTPRSHDISYSEECHAENQKAIAELRIRLDKLIEQTEVQTNVLRTIIGGPIDNLETLLQFRDQQQRFMAYDRRISAAAESLAVWILRAVMAGAVIMVLWSMGATGFLASLKSLFLSPR